jgi:hypothetical protein
MAAGAAARRARRHASDAESWSQTWLGTLGQLARAGQPLRCLTTSGARFEATLSAVGPDVVVAQTQRARVTLRSSALAAVEVLGTPVPMPDATVPDLRFVDLIADLVGTGERVRAVLAHGPTLFATVCSCGVDVVGLEAVERPVGPGRGIYYVALDSLSEVWSSSPS